MPEALFNISRYLMHELLFEQPKGVSKFAVHYALAKQGWINQSILSELNTHFIELGLNYFKLLDKFARSLK